MTHDTDAAGDSVTAKLGDVPCLFGTLASQRYNWDDVIRAIAEVEGIDDYRKLTSSKRRELVNKYPSSFPGTALCALSLA